MASRAGNSRQIYKGVKSPSGFYIARMGKPPTGVVLVYPNGVRFSDEAFGNALEQLTVVKERFHGQFGSHPDSHKPGLLAASYAFVETLVRSELNTGAKMDQGFERSVFLTHNINRFKDKDPTCRAYNQPQPVAAALQKLMDTEILGRWTANYFQVALVNAVTAMLSDTLKDFQPFGTGFAYSEEVEQNGEDGEVEEEEPGTAQAASST